MIQREENEFFLELEKEEQIEMLRKLRDGNPIDFNVLSEEMYDLANALNEQGIILKNPVILI